MLPENNNYSMTKFTLTFLLSIIAFCSYSQFWDIIPRPNIEYEPNTDLNLDNVKVLKIYKYNYKKGKKKGKRQLVYEQHLDTLGNTIMYIENEIDTTLFADLYTLLKKNIITYDSLNRPIEEISGNETKYWIYKDDKLIEYRVEVQSTIVEKRTYTYNGNQLNYSDCFYYDDIDGKCNEMIAILNNQNKPIIIVSTYNIDQTRVTDTRTLEYDDSGYYLGDIFNGERRIYKYSVSNYRTQYLWYDCNGILIYSEDYEYEMY